MAYAGNCATCPTVPASLLEGGHNCPTYALPGTGANCAIIEPVWNQIDAPGKRLKMKTLDQNSTQWQRSVTPNESYPNESLERNKESEVAGNLLSAEGLPNAADAKQQNLNHRDL